MASTTLEYVGVLGKTHGLDGTLSLSDRIVLPVPLSAGLVVQVGFSREFTRSYTIAEFIQTPAHSLVRFSECTSIPAAQELCDQALYAKPADVGFAVSDRYPIGAIEGCSVRDEGYSEIGVVSDVWLMPANDVWVVTTPSGKTIPLPVIDSVIVSVNLEQRVIVVRLLDGLETIDDHDASEHDA